MPAIAQPPGFTYYIEVKPMETPKKIVPKMHDATAVGKGEFSNVGPETVLGGKDRNSRQSAPSLVLKILNGDQSQIKLGKKISKKELTNKINSINFSDATIRINFEHPQYDQIISLDARPQPCLGDELECLWVRTNCVNQNLSSFKFQNLMIPNGLKLVVAEPELIGLNDEGICLRLPENSREVSLRKFARFPSPGIQVQLIQNSVMFEGFLLDFSSSSFHIELTAVSPQTFDWIHPEHTVTLMISDGGGVLFSGECNIIRHSGNRMTRAFVLAPIEKQISRFENKAFRSNRQVLTPSPDIIFNHPFIRKRVELKVIDLSGAGFSVKEERDASVLVPGMILPELELRFADGLSLKCKTQVVYRQELDDAPWVKCGLALLDMDSQDHIRLMALLHQMNNPNTYLCSNVDMDRLWDFFFETGFIYPEKYVHLQKNKSEIKSTFEKLYSHDSQIARHFIYQENSQILGHMSMLRFYTNSWIIQHHAAKTSVGHKAGLIVLDQAGQVVTDSHRLPCLHMQYIMCYYRPDNKFPNQVFGGAERAIKDSRGCSTDSFAYRRFKPAKSGYIASMNGWDLTDVQPEDLSELACFYAADSGGLMIDALDMGPVQGDSEDLIREFDRLGLKKERRLFALKNHDQLKAIIMVNLSDLGLNFSDLTNCIKVFALDPEVFRSDRLESLLFNLHARIGGKDIPVMLYPLSFIEDQSLSYEKVYTLWICSSQYSDPYWQYLKRLLRFI